VEQRVDAGADNVGDLPHRSVDKAGDAVGSTLWRLAENAWRLLDRVVHRLDELGEAQRRVGREATERAQVG
jgi:hypothetical protein